LHGSYLLRNGLDIAKVSKSLGHAKKSFTLDTYIHTIESVEEETASVMQDVLTAFKKPKNTERTGKIAYPFHVYILLICPFKNAVRDNLRGQST
jgi:hypothetical protein